MHVMLRRALHTALLSGGLLVAGVATAHAQTDDGAITDLVSDNPITVPVTAPIEVGDIDLNILGTEAAPAASAPSPSAPATPAPVATTDVTTGTEVPAQPADGTTDQVLTDAVSDNTVTAPVTAPIEVGDISLNVLGTETAPATEPAPATAAPAPAATTEVDAGSDGPAQPATATATDPLVTDAVTDNTVTAPVAAPIQVGDIDLNVLGTETAPATEPAPTTAAPAPTATTEVDAGSDGSAQAATDTDPLVTDAVTDNTVTAPVAAPIQVGDLGLNILGTETAPEGAGDAAPAPTTAAPAATTDVTTGTDDPAQPATDTDPLVTDAVTDNTVTAPVAAPIQVGDLGLNILGTETAAAGQSATPPAPVTAPVTDTEVTDSAGPGSAGLLESVLAGNVLAAPIAVPLAVGDIEIGIARLGTPAAPDQVDDGTTPVAPGADTTTPDTTMPDGGTPDAGTPSAPSSGDGTESDENTTVPGGGSDSSGMPTAPNGPAGMSAPPAGTDSDSVLAGQFGGAVGTGSTVTAAYLSGLQADPSTLSATTGVSVGAAGQRDLTEELAATGVGLAPTLAAFAALLVAGGALLRRTARA